VIDDRDDHSPIDILSVGHPGGGPSVPGAGDKRATLAKDKAAGGAPASKVNSGEMGKIIGWGRGQDAASVAQTNAVTASLTQEVAAGMVSKGVTKGWVTQQLSLYGAAVETGGKKLGNAQLQPRHDLMKTLLSLIP